MIVMIVHPSPVETLNGGESRVPQTDTEALREAFELAARSTSAAEARHRTLAWLIRHSIGQEAVDAAVLIVSELVTNAVVHGGGGVVSCALLLGCGSLCIEVTDQGTGRAEPAVRAPADDDVSGRGLLMVSTLSKAWGVTPAIPWGRTVWATVPIEGLRRLAVHEPGALVEELRPRGGELVEGHGGAGAEHGCPVAVLECQPDVVAPFDRGAHRIASHQPQQLATGLLVRRGHLIVGEVGAVRSQVRDQAGDQVPRVRQRGANTVEERGVVHLAAMSLLQ
jgi:anti-sigma regulatory factor (Ser/Thr protein kinase)